VNDGEYSKLDALGLRELVRRGEVTEDELASVARQAIVTVDSELNALALPLFEKPLEHDSGPFGGVPFVIKDVGPVAEGVPFTCGSRLFEGATAPRDTALMQRFREAGLAAIGATNVPEMAISFATESALHGVTRNPWDLERGTGGSSGGSAALVAAGAVPFAHGDDAAGSIRVPAACCGVVGLKPSRGRTPSGPYEWESFFGLGYGFGLTRTVRDAAALLDALHGPAPGEKYTAPAPVRPWTHEVGRNPGALRVAVTTEAWSGVPIDAECAAAASRVAGELEQLGHEVQHASPAIDGEDIVRVFVPLTTTVVAETMAGSRREISRDVLEAVSWTLFQEAQGLTALDLAAGFAAANAISRAVGRFFLEHDLLVTPTLGRLPAPHGTLRYGDPEHTVESWLRSIFDYGPFTAAFNISGEPAMSLPLAESRSGLPIGIQLVAPYGREDLLIQVAGQLEQALPWSDRRPPVTVGRSA
jgi:amidase